MLACAEPVADRVPGVLDAFGTRVHGDAAAVIDDRHLPRRGARIGGHQRCESLRRRLSRSEALQGQGAVAPLGERLRRDRAGARLHPRDAGAGAERAGLHADAEVSGLEVARDDRVGQLPARAARISALCARLAAW